MFPLKMFSTVLLRRTFLVSCVFTEHLVFCSYERAVRERDYEILGMFSVPCNIWHSLNALYFL